MTDEFKKTKLTEKELKLISGGNIPNLSIPGDTLGEQRSILQEQLDAGISWNEFLVFVKTNCSFDSTEYLSELRKIYNSKNAF